MAPMRLASFLLASTLISCTNTESNVRQACAVRDCAEEPLGDRCEINYGDRWARGGNHAVVVNVITFAPVASLFDALTAKAATEPSTVDGDRVWSGIVIPNEEKPVRISGSGLELPWPDGIRSIQTFEATSPDGTDVLVEGTGVRAFLRSVVAEDLARYGCLVGGE